MKENNEKESYAIKNKGIYDAFNKTKIAIKNLIFFI